VLTNLNQKDQITIGGTKMSNYIECDTCHLFTIEVLGDRALGCETCLNKDHDTEYESETEEN